MNRSIGEPRQVITEKQRVLDRLQTALQEAEAGKDVSATLTSLEQTTSAPLKTTSASTSVPLKTTSAPLKTYERRPPDSTGVLRQAFAQFRAKVRDEDGQGVSLADEDQAVEEVQEEEGPVELGNSLVQFSNFISMKTETVKKTLPKRPRKRLRLDVGDDGRQVHRRGLYQELFFA